MKKHFLMLSLLIPGKHAPTGKCFDVYLQPLLEELHILWTQGVATRDLANYRGIGTFNMRAILMWTIHDFPAYGLVAECVTKGYIACPCCGPETQFRRSATLSKNVYGNFQYRRYLPWAHPWRRLRSFNGEIKLRQEPAVVTGDNIVRWGNLREAWKRDGSMPAAADPARTYGIKRVSTLYQLPYWRVRFPFYSESEFPNLPYCNFLSGFDGRDRVNVWIIPLCVAVGK